MVIKCLRTYFDSLWMPTTLAGLTLVASLRQEMNVHVPSGTEGIVIGHPIWLSNALTMAFLVSLVSILVASIVPFAMGNRKRGKVSLALFVGMVVAGLIATLFFVPFPLD